MTDHTVMIGHDDTDSLSHAVHTAARDRKPLRITGGGTKALLVTSALDAATPDTAPFGEPLAVTMHHGIVHYDPAELVLTARAGTSLAAIERLLAEHRQMLGFEPPHFGEGATLGGTLACGLSGPRRPWTGSARDFVLGVRVINGLGVVLRFGGQVMKNVAGFDVARLMTGARGTLGILTEASLKVIPVPEAEVTTALECTASEAIFRLAGIAMRPLPISGAAHVDGRLHLRLSGNRHAVEWAWSQLGGEQLPDNGFWRALRDQTHPFFDTRRTLWRIAVPPATPPLVSPDSEWLTDWGGALRWYAGTQAPAEVLASVRAAGGTMRRWRGGSDGENGDAAASSPALHRLRARLKVAFDPYGILNQPYRTSL